jgi:hypothetical protein
MEVSFRGVRRRGLRLSQGFKKPGGSTGARLLKLLVPVRDGVGKPFAEFRELGDLLVKRSDLVRRHAGDSPARGPTRIPFFENACQLRETEPGFEGAADCLNTEESGGRVEAIPAFGAQWLREKAEFFVVADGVGTDARGSAEFARSQCAIGSRSHREMSMNPGIGSGVKRKDRAPRRGKLGAEANGVHGDD